MSGFLSESEKDQREHQTPAPLRPSDSPRGRYMSIGPLPPAGTSRFLDLDLPERFMLQVRTSAGEWLEEAVCLSANAGRLDDGSYAIGTGGVGIMLRCVEKHADHFVHVDGGGRRFQYRLLPIEGDGRIQLPEGGALYPRGHPKFPGSQ